MDLLPSRIAELLRTQQGVATFTQLGAVGVSRSEVRAEIDGRRWQRYGDQCVVTHNSEPTRQQWMWIALLDNRVPAALAGLTALEVAGFRHFGDCMELIHVVAARGSVYHPFPGVKIHESRRFSAPDIVTPMASRTPHSRARRWPAPPGSRGRPPCCQGVRLP